jgi:hypothetical protein
MNNIESEQDLIRDSSQNIFIPLRYKNSLQHQNQMHILNNTINENQSNDINNRYNGNSTFDNWNDREIAGPL